MICVVRGDEKSAIRRDQQVVELAREKMNSAFFLGLHSLFLSLKQRNQIIFNYSGNFVFSTFDYRLAYGGRGKAQRPRVERDAL